PNIDELKALSAGLAASGSIALYHIYNVTPEEKKFRENSYERIDVRKRDLTETLAELSIEEKNEHICIGCPQCSMREIAEIARKVAGKKVKRELWVFTSSTICKEAKLKGYVDVIERAGGKMISDTCMVVSPMKMMGVRGVITNSCKAAHYIPNTCEIPVALKDINNCIKVALGK
ncbi:hypothetical protein DRO61_10535, partial [Candidatus Bathyarchaeota archaeon]